MIETRARVRSVSGGKVWVEADSQQGCAACHSKSSCGVSGLGKYFSRRKPPVALACDLPVEPGEELVLNMSEGDLLRAGLLGYVLPTVLAVAAAVAASMSRLGDAAAVAAMAAGFIAGLAVARGFSRAPRIAVSRPAALQASHFPIIPIKEISHD